MSATQRGYVEDYRGARIEVIRDDQYPIVRLTYPDGGTITYNDVTAARHARDHQLDRNCTAHRTCR